MQKHQKCYKLPLDILIVKREGIMDVKVGIKDDRFRIESQELFTDWLPDTLNNRYAIVVYLRLLKNNKGRRLFTLRELAVIVGSKNKQAASQHMEDFRECGERFDCFVIRKRKVDEGVVNAILRELLKNPLAKAGELVGIVNKGLNRNDITVQNILAGIDQIPYGKIINLLHYQLSKGQIQYQESFLLEEMMNSLSNKIGIESGLGMSAADEGMEITDPTAIRKLITADVPMDQINSSSAWICIMMVLYYWNVPLSVIGRWFHVNKTTVLRWIIGLAASLCPIIYQQLIKGVKGTKVFVDEKWIKIKGKWHYWFVVMDVAVELPIVAVLLKSRGKWACKYIGCLLARLKKLPKVVITDGLAGYNHMVKEAKHVLCIFHHQQGITRWLKGHVFSIEQIKELKKMMKQVFQTKDKRTVRQRLEKLEKKGEKLGIKDWVDMILKRLPSLICSVGSVRIPSTTNTIEQFFRAFNRFYKTRCGFHSVISAKRELILFLVVYLFSRRDKDNKAPIEAILPEASRMPLYILINDPLKTLMVLKNVKQKHTMTNFLLGNHPPP